MRSDQDPIRKFVELRELGHALDRAGWPSPLIALQRLREFLSNERARPSNKTLRGALTYANEAGDTETVLRAARLLGEQDIFEDAYLFGQVAIARIKAGLADISSWRSFLARDASRPQDT